MGSTVFNSRLQPTQIALGTVQGGVDKLNLAYEYGTWENGVLNAQKNNGNVAKQTINVLSQGGVNGFTAVQKYEYDPLNRLKSAVENIDSDQTPSWKQTFTFDRYGNRNFDEANTTTLPKNCGTAPNFTVCPADLPVVNPSADPTNNRLNGYQFDDAGNTKRDAQSRKFTYDAENKQTKVETLDANGNPVNTIGIYEYDGDGRRVKKISATEITVFVYNASGQLVADYSTNVEPAQTARVSYLTSDHLGSPRITTDRDGKVFSRRDFMPYGEEITADQTPQRSTNQNYGEDRLRQKFTSYERDDETDLDFAKARMYGFNAGRFSSADDFRNDTYSTNPQSWNLFVYVRNNPLKFVDPFGKSTNCPEGQYSDGEGNCYAPAPDDGQIHCENGCGELAIVYVSSESTEIIFYQTELTVGDFSKPLDIPRLPSQTPCTLPQTARQRFVSDCVKGKVDARVSTMNRQRDEDLKFSLLGSMHPGPLPSPFGGIVGAATGESIFPDSVTKNEQASTALAVAGMADIRNAGPIGAAFNALGASLVEGTYNSYKFRQRLAEASISTETDKQDCEALADAAGI